MYYAEGVDDGLIALVESAMFETFPAVGITALMKVTLPHFGDPRWRMH